MKNIFAIIEAGCKLVDNVASYVSCCHECRPKSKTRDFEGTVC